MLIPIVTLTHKDLAERIKKAERRGGSFANKIIARLLRENTELRRIVMQRKRR